MNILDSLRDRIKELEAKIKELENPWVNVEDRLPEEGLRCLTTNGYMRAISIFENKEFSADVMYRLVDELGDEQPTKKTTYWVQLPEIPKPSEEYREYE